MQVKWQGTACLAAVEIMSLAALLAAGCGDGGGIAEVDVTALNAALAVREGALAERLARLSPATVVEARQKVKSALDESGQTLDDLPAADSEKRLALVGTLARFRRDVGQIETNAFFAARAEVRAFQGVKTAADRLAALDATLEEEEWRGFLETFPGKAGETERLLAGWRKQRLEKMANGEGVTFPAFQTAAVEHYDEWERWADGALAKQRLILGGILPETLSVLSNLQAWAAEVRHEHGRVDAAIADMRAIPADDALVGVVKKEVLEAFDDGVAKAAAAMSQWSLDEMAFPDVARVRSEACQKRANALESDMAAFIDAHGPYLPVTARLDVADVAKQARASVEKGTEDASAFRNGMEKLQEEGASFADDVETARQTASILRDRTDVDEETLVANLSKIMLIRRRMEEVGAVDLRAALLERKMEAEKALSGAEAGLDVAENSFNAAKAKALADEKAAKWEEEKGRLRDSLDTIRARLNADPPPGYTRPDGEARALLSDLDGVLANIDTKEEEGLRAEGALIQSKAKDIAGRTLWTPGARHPAKPHVFAMEKENMWDADPGYWFDHPGENSDLVVSWRPGRRHPDHPHISAGREEGTWVPDPGYRERWSGDLDPEWTIGERHPERPHIFASRENGKDVWDCDPGYVWVEPGSHNLDCYWMAGRRHPDFEGIVSAQQEGSWNTLPGWQFVYPGTSDLQTRWVPGARFPGKPHIHAGTEKWKWSSDDGYDFDEYNSSNLSVHWAPGRWHSSYRGIIAAQQEGYWETAAGWAFVAPGATLRGASDDLRAKWMPGTWHPTQRHVFASQNENRWSCEDGYTFVNHTGSDLTARWTPGWISSDGQRRAKETEGRFERKRDCPSCVDGWKVTSTRCGLCSGTGKLLFGMVCQTCRGSGRVQSKVLCANCRGVGWKWQ